MKIIGLAAIALLINDASAVRISDIGDLDLPPLVNEADAIADKTILA